MKNLFNTLKNAYRKPLMVLARPDSVLVRVTRDTGNYLIEKSIIGGRVHTWEWDKGHTRVTPHVDGVARPQFSYVPAI